MSELISSRTCRAFSRAEITHATTDSRLARSKIDRSTSPSALPARSGRSRPRLGTEVRREIPASAGAPIQAEIQAHVDHARHVFSAF